MKRVSWIYQFGANANPAVCYVKTKLTNVVGTNACRSGSHLVRNSAFAGKKTWVSCCTLPSEGYQPDSLARYWVYFKQNEFVLVWTSCLWWCTSVTWIRHDTMANVKWKYGPVHARKLTAKQCCRRYVCWSRATDAFTPRWTQPHVVLVSFAEKFATPGVRADLVRLSPLGVKIGGVGWISCAISVVITCCYAGFNTANDVRAFRAKDLRFCDLVRKHACGDFCGCGFHRTQHVVSWSSENLLWTIVSVFGVWRCKLFVSPSWCIRAKLSLLSCHIDSCIPKNTKVSSTRRMLKIRNFWGRERFWRHVGTRPIVHPTKPLVMSKMWRVIVCVCTAKCFCLLQNFVSQLDSGLEDFSSCIVSSFSRLWQITSSMYVEFLKLRPANWTFAVNGTKSARHTFILFSLVFRYRAIPLNWQEETSVVCATSLSFIKSENLVGTQRRWWWRHLTTAIIPPPPPPMAAEKCSNSQWFRGNTCWSSASRHTRCQSYSWQIYAPVFSLICWNGLDTQEWFMGKFFWASFHITWVRIVEYVRTEVDSRSSSFQVPKWKIVSQIIYIFATDTNFSFWWTLSLSSPRTLKTSALSCIHHRIQNLVDGEMNCFAAQNLESKFIRSVWGTGTGLTGTRLAS